MTDQDMQTAIIQAIQTDPNLIILIRFALTNNIPNIETARLTIMMNILNLPITS